MKRKSIKENETRVNKLINQFTYNLQRKKQNEKNKQTNKNRTKQIYLIHLTWKEKKKKHTGEAFEN